MSRPWSSSSRTNSRQRAAQKGGFRRFWEGVHPGDGSNSTMSVPFYYQSGNQFSKTLKDDIARVKRARPSRFSPHRTTEQRGDGTKVRVTVEPTAVAPTPQQRHNLAHGRRH